MLQLCRESLNTDGHQFHQYQQNETIYSSPQFVNIKETMTYMTLEIQVLVWDRHRSVAVLNQLMGKQPQSLLIIKHPTPNTDINKR